MSALAFTKRLSACIGRSCYRSPHFIATQNSIRQLSTKQTQQEAPQATTETIISEQASEGSGSNGTNGGQSQQNRSGASWQMKWHKMRRLAMIFGIPAAIGITGFKIHDSDWPYVKALDAMLTNPKYRLPEGKLERELTQEEKDKIRPPMYILYPPMIWATWAHSWRPYRVLALWDKFMPLLDSKYPSDVRMIPVACLMSMLGGGGDTSQPPEVFFSKCRIKLEILKGCKADSGWTTEKFLNTIYQLCVDQTNGQIMMAGWQLLMELTQKPREPSENAIKYVMKHNTNENLTREKAKLLLYMYQDPRDVVSFANNTLINPKLPSYDPHFEDLQRILVKNKGLQFAFNAMDHSSPQIQQVGLMVIAGIVSNYPDWDELMNYLGDTEDEKLYNSNKIVTSFMNVGQDHFIKSENQAALNAFKEAIKFHPKSAMLRYFAGNCNAELGNIEEAKKEYELAMNYMQPELRPMPEAAFQMANLLLKHGNSMNDWEYASDLLETIIDRGLLSYLQIENIELEHVYYTLQQALEKCRDYENAFMRMNTLCTSISPGSHTAHFECGRMALLCKKYEMAEERLKKACELEQYDMHYKYYLALSQFHCWQEYGKYNNDNSDLIECNTNLNLILNSRPNDTKALNLLLKIKMIEKNWNECLNILDRISGKIVLHADTHGGDKNKNKNKNKKEKSEKNNNKKDKDLSSHVSNTQYKPNGYIEYQKGVIYENMNDVNSAINAFEMAVNEWQKCAERMGFSNYFNSRPSDRKALQKIQMRCETHQNDKEWKSLCDCVFALGTTA